MPIECAVDTGFSGGLLIPFSLFESLGLLSSLSPHPYSALMPDSLYTSRGEILLGKIKIPSEVHSSPSLDKKLVGRAFLRALVMMLDGRKEELSLFCPCSAPLAFGEGRDNRAAETVSIRSCFNERSPPRRNV